MVADKKSQTKSKSQYQEEIEKDWRLILHDDTVHTIQEVCDIVAKVSYSYCHQNNEDKAILTI
ncbi:hypothetical protein EON65_49075 [archaeon]|nr:MAG: hypothetical protein EON65_49075 [archaeon]